MSSKNKLIINCGTTYVVAGEFSASAGRLILEKFKTQELIYDYSNQDQWLSALSVALKAMRLSGKATIIAPASLLLTKTIKVPNVSGDQQSEVIRFEASKAIPYDLKDVTWDYQEIFKDEVETEILLVPMKASVADELCAAVASAGIIPETLEASSILDYNAWKFCGLEDDVIVLNVGAKSSNLLIARSDGFFVRSIPIGGNTLTQAIADSLGKPFDQAEEIKKQFFASNASSGGNPAADLFITNAQNAMKRIGMELKRSILNYRRKAQIKMPTKILLTGRASLLPGFAEFLSEDQKMNVEYFDALTNVSVGFGVNQALLNESATQISELIGEAARMLLPSSVGVNLLPEHIVKEMAFKRKKPYLLAAAALLAVSVVPPVLYLNSAIAATKSATQQLSAATPEIKARIEAIDESKERVEALIAKIKDLEVLARSKANWINLFVDLEKRLVDLKDIWLDNLRVVRTGTGAAAKYNLELTGKLLIREIDPANPEAYDSSKAIDRVNKLLSSFKESSFIKDYGNVRTDPSNPRILKFDFTLIVNPDKPI